MRIVRLSRRYLQTTLRLGTQPHFLQGLGLIW